MSGNGFNVVSELYEIGNQSSISFTLLGYSTCIGTVAKNTIENYFKLILCTLFTIVDVVFQLRTNVYLKQVCCYLYLTKFLEGVQFLYPFWGASKSFIFRLHGLLGTYLEHNANRLGWNWKYDKKFDAKYLKIIWKPVFIP